jgi:hypothetical protein
MQSTAESKSRSDGMPYLLTWLPYAVRRRPLYSSPGGCNPYTVAPVSNDRRNMVRHIHGQPQSVGQQVTGPPIWYERSTQTNRQRSHRHTVHNTSRVPASVHNLRLELRHPQLTLHRHQWTQLHLPRAACSHPAQYNTTHTYDESGIPLRRWIVMCYIHK